MGRSGLEGEARFGVGVGVGSNGSEGGWGARSGNGWASGSDGGWGVT